MKVRTESEAWDKLDPLLVNALGLARMLCCSVRTIWRLNAAGKLPRPVKIGRSVRWARSDIERWLEELKGGSN